MTIDRSLPPAGATDPLLYTETDGVLSGAEKIREGARTVGASTWGTEAAAIWIGNFGSINAFIAACRQFDSLNRIVAGQMNQMADHLQAHATDARNTSVAYVDRAPQVPTNST